MKNFFLIFVLLYALTLEATESCYSVQLSNQKNTENNVKSYIPDGCSLLHIGQYSTIRCGCTEHKKDISPLLDRFKTTFPNALIVQTYKYRFVKKQTEKKKRKQLPTHHYDFLWQFPPHKCVSTSHEKRIKEPFFKNQEKEKRLLDKFNLYGLHLSANYDQYFNQNYKGREYSDFEYNIKLKYNLLKNGYLQHTKDLATIRDKDTIVRNQYRLNLKNYKLEDTINQIGQLKTLIDKAYYKALLDVTKEYRQEEEVLAKKGVTPGYIVSLIKANQLRYKELLKLYKTETINVNPSTLQILSKMEKLRLVDEKKLITFVKEHNLELKLQNKRLKTLQDKESYLDNSSLNVYASRRKIDEIGQYNTLGIEMDIPLDFTTSQDNTLKKLQKSDIEIYKKALLTHFKNQINTLYKNFQIKQILNSNNKMQLDILYRQLANYEQLKNNKLAILNLDMQKKIYLLKQQILNIRHQTSLNKLEQLKIFFTIATITGQTNIQNILIKRD